MGRERCKGRRGLGGGEGKRAIAQALHCYNSATKSPDPSFKFDLEESFTNLSELMILTEDKAKGVHLNQVGVVHAKASQEGVV